MQEVYHKTVKKTIFLLRNLRKNKELRFFEMGVINLVSACPGSWYV